VTESKTQCLKEKEREGKKGGAGLGGDRGLEGGGRWTRARNQ